MISSSIGDSLKEDLAWATYVLLRNTSTVAVVCCSFLIYLVLFSVLLRKLAFFLQLISIQGELCVRGYWNCPGQMSKAQLHDWFKRKVDEIGLTDVKETLYFPQYAGILCSSSLFSSVSTLFCIYVNFKFDFRFCIVVGYSS